MTNLETVLDIASRQLSAAGVDCILIGGFAVNFHGYTRNNLDMESDIRPLCDRFGTLKTCDLIRCQVEALRKA
jgi:hypothetical protein